ERARQKRAAEPIAKYLTLEQRKEMIDQMFAEMKNAARDLDFERAAELRDDINRLQALDS
ncbi:MAG TPA: UvrB/UvrC motif-containing protein, partial [Candidatus Didemnitutus sp.]|nr:UvrB/UvrC motif-containing protein [Candidatus Didemnitutus sp.]